MHFEGFSRSARRLSVRLTLWHSLIFLSCALLVLALTYALLRNRAESDAREATEFRLSRYVTDFKKGGIPAVQYLASLRKGRAQKAYFVRVADSQNKTLFQRDLDEWAEFRLEQLEQLPTQSPGSRQWLTLHARHGLKLLLASECLPDGSLVQVGNSNEDILDLLSDYQRSAFFVLLGALPVSVLGGAFFSKRALRPVGQLTSAAQEIISTSRFQARVPEPGSGDELDELVRVFNQMLGRIETLVRELRDSIDNVAHDLRTPITRLRHKAQSAIEASLAPESAPVSPIVQSNIDALADCIEEADRVTTMLNTIMAIAETQAGLANLKREPLKVAHMVDRCINSYSDFADDRAVKVRSVIDDSLMICADEIAISRVLSNLLDNGIKYTGEGGHVTISASRSDELVTIRFADDGIGIPPEDLPRIWDRLFRSDRSRSQRGLGLGLSFVQAIVLAHQGAVHAELNSGGGTIIEVALPAA